MIYQDRVYGGIEILEPVILDLINSPAMQRLKGVDQAGYFQPFVNVPDVSHSRFEHSLGVYILLKKYGAPLEEQISGLIHDVSHSSFSHCIDYVLSKVSYIQEQNYQDNIFDDFVRKTEIPEILKKYGFDLDFILNDENFLLKEKDLPDLCADRIDYSLRDGIHYAKFEKSYMDYFLDNLIAENNQWVFKDFESAKKYAEFFRKMNAEFWAGMPTALMFTTVGDYLRYALEKNYLSKDDLYTTDKEVLDRVNAFLNKDEKLKLFWDRMNNKVGSSLDEKNYYFLALCKSRAVDPLCKLEGKILRVSDIDKNWKNILEENSKAKKYPIKFEK
jgi:HD superfamily phosphohydrolase